MKTRYRVLTVDGMWKVVASKKPIRNINIASQIAKEQVIQVKIGTLIDQFKFWVR